MTISLEGDLLVVSDIHLLSATDERGRLLLDIIARATESDLYAFVLLGDIFDFCLGSTRYFKQKFAPFGEALTRLAASGTKVYFFEGNHEFELPELGWSGVTFIPEGSHEIALPGGESMKLAHGDLVYASDSYLAFRNFVKSRFVRYTCRYLVPSRLLDRYATTHAKVSRSTDSFRELDDQALMRAMNTWVSDGTCTHGIFGHFHVPYAEPRKDGEGLLVCLDSWDKPNLLLFKDHTFWRGFLTPDRKDWRLEKTQPYLS